MRTRVELDREDQASHTITVTATDPSNRTDTVATTNTVEDVDETPEVTGETNPEFDENESGIVAFYTSTDPDHKGIEWVLNGTDSDDFTLSGGTLTFNVVPDFEDPADSNRDNRYQATIEAREQGDGTSVGRLSVTVQVTNVDEPGVVEVPVTYPRVGQRLTPTIVDPDEGVGSIKWKWESSPDGTNWTPIQGATSRSYTPTRDDDGKILRVTVIYRDRQGPGKTHTHEFDQPCGVAAVLRRRHCHTHRAGEHEREPERRRAVHGPPSRQHQFDLRGDRTRRSFLHSRFRIRTTEDQRHTAGLREPARPRSRGANNSHRHQQPDCHHHGDHRRNRRMRYRRRTTLRAHRVICVRHQPTRVVVGTGR